MKDESLTTSFQPEQSTVLPYRVRTEGSTIAAFDTYGDAAAYAEQYVRQQGAVEIVFSLTAI